MPIIKTLLSTILFSYFIFVETVSAQNESADYERGAFPDTIKVGREQGEKIYSLDSIEGVIIDTLTNPDGFIFRKSIPPHYIEIYFARKKGNYFMVYQLGTWPLSADFKFDRIDFNGSGTKELLMLNKYEKKHRLDSPEDEDGFGKSFSIWDLDSVGLLAVFYNYYISHHLWQNDTVVMKTCFNLIPSIKKKEIIFNQSGKCNDCNEGIELVIKKPLQIKYKLISSGLIKTSESGGKYHISKMGNIVPNISGKYKCYIDKDRRFSFQIPVEWAIQKGEEGELNDIAIPIERDSANPQYSENGFFTIDTFGEGVCDSIFMNREGFSGNDSAFYTYDIAYNNSGRPEFINQVIPIKGKNWNGYMHLAPWGQLKNERRDYHGDICEKIYFFDGKHNIIKIYTIGNELNENVRKKLIESFKFF